MPQGRAALRGVDPVLQVRTRAAEQLLATGKQAEGNTQLQRAATFYRKARAAAYLRQPRRCWPPQRDLAWESAPPEASVSLPLVAAATRSVLDRLWLSNSQQDMGDGNRKQGT